MCLSAYIFGHNIYKTRISNEANEFNLGFDLFVCESTEIHRKSTQVDDRRDDSASRVCQVLAFSCVFFCFLHRLHLPAVEVYCTFRASISLCNFESFFFVFFLAKLAVAVFCGFCRLKLRKFCFWAVSLACCTWLNFRDHHLHFSPALCFFFYIFFSHCYCLFVTASQPCNVNRVNRCR